jgi:sugar lactone lactonase YvrE
MRLYAALLALAACPSSFGQANSVEACASGLPVGIPATAASLGPVSGIATDSTGNVILAASGYNSIFRLGSSGVLTLIAGNGTGGFDGDGGPATSARLNAPRGVAVDAAENLYIADSWNNRVRKVSRGVITTVAGNGTAGFSGDNGPAGSAQLSRPSAVAVDSSGNLYIADRDNNRVRKVSRGVITTIAGTGGVGFSGRDGPATSAKVSPLGIAADLAGNVYIAYVTASGARIVKLSNGAIATVGAPWIAGSTGAAELTYPAGVAVDSAGNFYMADLENNRIRKVSNGVITTVAGDGTQGFSGDRGSAIRAQLASPEGIAADAAGNLYIADLKNNRVRKVSKGLIATVGGNGLEACAPGPATLSSQLIQLLRQQRYSLAHSGIRLSEDPALREVRSRPAATATMLRMFGSTLDLNLRNDLLEQLGRIAQAYPLGIGSLKDVTDEQLLLLVRALGEKSTSTWAQHVLDALTGYAQTIKTLTTSANAQRQLFERAEKGTNDARMDPLRQPATPQPSLRDALALIGSAKIADTALQLGPDRLLAVARDYPETRASVRALEALPLAGLARPGYYYARVAASAVKVSERATLRSLTAAIQSKDASSWLAGIKAAYYVLLTEPGLRREFMEDLLMEHDLAMSSRPVGDSYNWGLGNLLTAMSRDYQPELRDIFRNADDPRVKQAAQDYVADKRLPGPLGRVVASPSESGVKSTGQ